MYLRDESLFYVYDNETFPVLRSSDIRYYAELYCSHSIYVESKLLYFL